MTHSFFSVGIHVKMMSICGCIGVLLLVALLSSFLQFGPQVLASDRCE